jgi:hypothetical protein
MANPEETRRERADDTAARGGGNRKPLPFSNPRLLAERFVAAVLRLRSDPDGEAWARSVLTPAEHALWARLSTADRRHAVQAARRVQRRLASTAYAGDLLWPGAALMHDVGKVESGLSILERVVATLASKAVNVATARDWTRSATGLRRRIGSYLIHGEVGADMIRAAGGREAIAAWTEVHQGYRGLERSGVPPAVVEALIHSDVG